MRGKKTMIEIMTILLYGEELNPLSLIEQLSKGNDFLVENIIIKGELSKFSKKTHKKSGCYIKSKSTGCYKDFNAYEAWYVEFLEKNFDLIKKSNVTDIQIWTDLYMTKGNHGFEVFTRENLNKLFGMNVALPIDFHILSKKSIIEFADEMNIKYNKKSEIY